MRLFVAAEIAPPVIESAQRMIAELRQRIQALAPRARVTWIPPDLMHLTIRFVGNVSDADLPALMDVLRPPIPMKPFALHVAGVGAFPLRGAPRVLRADLAAGVDELCAVEVEVTRRLQQVGIAPDERVFAPHLTLGRVRDAAGLRTSTLAAGLEAAALGTSTIDAITLFESQLSPKGPTYIPLLRTPLWK